MAYKIVYEPLKKQKKPRSLRLPLLTACFFGLFLLSAHLFFGAELAAFQESVTPILSAFAQEVLLGS